MAKLPIDVSQRVKDAIVNAMQRSSYDRTKTVQSFLSSIKQVYTLPIGTELRSPTQKYRIVEILGETSLYIKYKAVLSNGSKTNNNRVLMGNETTVLAQYYIFEWFEKDKDKRIDSTNLQKPSFRDWNSECISVFAREMHKLIPKKCFVEKDDYGRFKAEEFKANNTYYYSRAIMPKASVLKVLFEAIRNAYFRILKGIRKNIHLLIAAVIGLFLAILMIRGSEILARLTFYSVNFVEETFFKAKQETVSSKNKKTPSESSTPTKVKNDTVTKIGKVEVAPKPQPIKPTKKEITDDELFKEAKTISDFKALADRKYKKAYYPLAEKYYLSNDFAKAREWTNKCIMKHVDVSKAKELIEKIDKNIQAEEAYQKAEKYILEKQYDKALFYARKALSLKSLKSKQTNRLTDIVILCERWNPPIYSE